MDTRTLGDLRILTPDIDPRDLEDTTEPPDFELVEARVDGATWAQLELAGTSLRLSHLTGVELTEAFWRNVSLYGCRFERVDLSGARLTGLNAERCEFIGCRMTGVQIAESVLKNVLFEDCRMDYSSLEGVRANGPVGWATCNLDRAVLANCRFPGAVLQACSLRKAELRDCDLRETDLRQCDLNELDGLSSLRGALIGVDQVVALAAIAVREFGIEVLDS